MKLEWTSMNLPLDGGDYCWQPGTVVNFDTQEAQARELRMTMLFNEVTSYKDEFVVVDIYKNEKAPKHLVGYFIKLVKIEDGIISGKTFEIGYPTKPVHAAKWLRVVDRYTIVFENNNDDEVITEHQAMNR